MLRFPRTVVLVALLAAGCSSNSSVHGIFGPAGGTLSDDSATLTIPPGALASETTITLTPAPGIAAPEGTLQVGTPQILTPEGQIFVSPVTLQMKFDPSKLAGHPSSAIAVYTAPVGSTSYSTLSTGLVDEKDVSARTNHFSIFQPDVPISPSATTGGSTGTTGGKGTDSTGSTGRGSTGEGSTGKGSTGGRTSGNTASGGSSTGGSNTGTDSGGTSAGTTSGTTSGTTGGELPDAGEEDAGPDGGESDAGPGVPDSGGTAICSTSTDCIGALGCVAIAIDSKSNGFATCNNPFLAPIDVSGGGIGNGGFLNPGTTPPFPALNVSVDFWSVEMDLACCPATTGTVAVSAVVNWSAGGVNCDGDPKGKGTIDFTQLDDGGLAGTFNISVLNGMTGSFSFPATLDGTFCDAGQPVLPPAPVEIEDAGADAGTADCSPDLDCLGPDAGGLSGTGSFWLNPGATPGGTWCKGPLDDLVSTASIAGATAPTLTVTNNSGFFELQATLPCCPAGPGTLAATSIDLSSNVCGVTPNQPSPMVSGGTGTVTFTQTDGGLVGSIHLDGTTEADATFSL